MSGPKDQSPREAEMTTDLGSATEKTEPDTDRKAVHKVFIGIGSNLGDRQRACLEALERISRLPETCLQGCSAWYLTRPVGVTGQDWYVNGVAQVATALSPPALLHELQNIEKQMGRIRRERWEARVIDLDILFFDQEILTEGDLQIPHPRVHERRFALLPLLELAPDLVHPVLGRSIRELLDRLDPLSQEVTLLKEVTA